MSSESNNQAAKKKQPQRNNHRGRGSGGGRGGQKNSSNFSGGGRGHQSSNFAGRGPKHFGNKSTRPDSIIPKPVALTSDSEEDDYDDDEGVNFNISGGDEMNRKFANQHVDHNTPVNAPPSSSNANANATTSKQQHSRTRHSYCLICYTHNISHYRSILPCGHDDICAPCMLRIRYLDNDTQCPVCKASNDVVIIDKDNFDVDETDASDGLAVHHKKFNQYELWGNEILSGGHPDNNGKFVYKEDVGMHFPRDVYEKVVTPLCGYACGLEFCSFVNNEDSYVNERDVNDNGKRGGDNNNTTTTTTREVKRRLTGIKALKAHLRMEHGMMLCDLCVDNKRNFVYNLQRFTPQGLKKHENDKQEGHPLCEFCRPKRFYDIVKLHEHLNKEHYKCHICDKQGKPNQFFKDYNMLEKHFDREHYMCHDAQCLAARFVVFENEIDLRAHEQGVHGTSRRDGGTKIKLEFRVRREGEHIEQALPTGEDFQFGLNGEAFVPDALPGQELQVQQLQQRQVNEPEITNAAHAARTAHLRALAANIRERDGIAGGGSGGAEAFPALGGASSSGMLVGWSSDGARSVAGSRLKKTAAGQVTDEEFPSLVKPSTSRRDRMAALGLGPKKAHQPAMRGANFSSVASRPTSTPIFTASYSSSIPITRAPDMNRDNFPSLGGGPKPFVPTYGGSSSSSSSRDAPNLGVGNFPSLGGMSSSRGGSEFANPYLAANAHAKKLRGAEAAPLTPAFPSLSNSDFPAPPAVSTKKKSSVSSAFAPKKPPPLDNILQFPPPSSTQGSSDIKKGMNTVESLKQELGLANYKKLKSLTKDFASGSKEPERYVDEAASLFDLGVTDKAFWEHIPCLIESCPNKAGVNQAMSHLESLRMANRMQEMEFGGDGSAPKKPIDYILPAKKMANSWGNNAGGQSTKARNRIAAPVEIEAPVPAANSAKNVGGESKKSKNKNKNNELRALAFGA
jgi:hypothetical protein